jgi:hypothetical protein
MRMQQGNAITGYSYLHLHVHTEKPCHQATYYYSHPRPRLPVFVKLHEYDLTVR